MAPPAIEDKILVFVTATATDAAQYWAGDFTFSMAETSTGEREQGLSYTELPRVTPWAL